jgi:hypothetical protein
MRKRFRLIVVSSRREEEKVGKPSVSVNEPAANRKKAWEEVAVEVDLTFWCRR